MENKLSKYQTALAINVAEFCRLQKSVRTLWEVAAESGKLRVISCLALLLLMNSRAKKVNIVYPKKTLMDRDQREYADYLMTQMPPLLPAVMYHCDLSFAIARD